ncbi:uncharacterized protein DUF421 [Pseudomonas sp. SJZ085]|uniref:YetF domain-containing protein n=1 Tax=unclassified Pseudomonas TaxID=196821 RepID=UPI0011998D64|nr:MULTISPECIES: YetF domain-containing protein [unclassified Pseudomonas]TWC24795.1 uncharacterized protein DUF421 [Pseudomonas sp. SJZ074]TWC40988.1 uncharacterized protein DUF421 [Pseudomonas sp. SJZ085]
MDSVLCAGAMYLALMVLFKIAGRRSLADLTTFDFVLLMIIVEDGRILQGRMRLARLVEADIMEAARSSQGIETLEQIKFAIIERNGKISVIAKES